MTHERKPNMLLRKLFHFWNADVNYMWPDILISLIERWLSKRKSHFICKMLVSDWPAAHVVYWESLYLIRLLTLIIRDARLHDRRSQAQRGVVNQSTDTDPVQALALSPNWLKSSAGKSRQQIILKWVRFSLYFNTHWG